MVDVCEDAHEMYLQMDLPEITDEIIDECLNEIPIEVDREFIKDFILNAIAFLPFGIYLPLLNKKHSLFKGALYCLCFSLCFEIAQLFTRVGSFSSNDLIANTLGYFLGVIIYNLLGERFIKSAIKYVNVIVIILVIPFLIYEFSETLSHFSVYLYKTL